MADDLRLLDHVYVIDRAVNQDFTRAGQGDAKIRKVEHRAHGLVMRNQLQRALAGGDAERRAVSVSLAELKALGTIIVLDGAEAAFPLRLDSLDSFSRHRVQPRPRWLLLSVQPADDDRGERATVWVSDEYRAGFLKLFEDYLTKRLTTAAPKNWTTTEGNPSNQALIANIAQIRHAALADLWTSEGEPPTHGIRWWELWLDTTRPGLDTFEAFAAGQELRVVPRSLTLRDRRVVWVEATWDQLQVLPFTPVPIAEVRSPEFVDTIEDLPRSEQDEYVRDLAARVTAAPASAPAVCHLDSGVFRGHLLLKDSLSASDVHTVIGTSGEDENGHGTSMAGLALYGPLDPLLSAAEPVRLTHRLESVRLLPRPGESLPDPRDYGTATATAASLPEIGVGRPRVFCLTLSTQPDTPGQPTLWSATVDALAAGTDVVREGEHLRLLSTPDPEAARLMVVAAGNVDSYQQDFLTESDTSGIEDPAQAWNVLTVGAYTDLHDKPSDPAYSGWIPLASRGGLSPHSRTSILFAGRQWPIKPDICMEGGNVLTDGGTGFEVKHPLLSLRSIGTANDLALARANATSAASAQAARLAALTMARYPEYWPETVRGLLTHKAEWTAPMHADIRNQPGKTQRLNLLRRYGWGVPTEQSLLGSSEQAVTLVTQDQFIPFDGPKHRMRHLRLHTLPWPAEALQSLGGQEARLRVTLSYFIEPSASRRGWRRRHAYASHGLRFDLQAPLETRDEFVRRVNREAQRDEDGTVRPSSSSASERWVIGPNQRHLGSLHQDEWVGTGAELAATNSLAVYPVGGWWKNNGRADRISLPVRYALLVSLRTEHEQVSLYTEIASQIGTPVPVAVG
ncbi:S8 family peptidase [Pseudonocardia sichuanensis]